MKTKDKKICTLVDISGIISLVKYADGSFRVVYSIEYEFDNNDTVIYNVTDNCWIGESHWHYDHNQMIQCALEWYDVSFDELEDTLRERCPYEVTLSTNE